MSFLSIQLLKDLSQPSHLTYTLLPFLFIIFSTLNSFRFFLCFFFIKRCNNFFPFKITNHISSRHSVFNFFNHKNVFRPIWNIAFGKVVFVFWHSQNITNFISLIYLLELIYVFDFTSTGFILIVLWYVLLHLVTISFNLSIYTFFGIQFMCL